MSAWQIVLKSLPELLVAMLKYTIPITLISFALGLILAVLVALVRISPSHQPVMRGLKGLTWFYVWIFRGTPLLVQLFLIFFGLPYLKMNGHAIIELNAWTAGILTFSLNTGAYASETIRAAILSVPKTQWDAAKALGMKKSLILRLVIFPQALRIALPPLSNSFISLIKDTSLASGITIIEMFQVSQQFAALYYNPLVSYSLVAFLYLMLTTVLTGVQSWLEKRTSRYLLSEGQ
ncbi:MULTISPECIES: amino acid ABC transporter permease [unclassified Lacticaseibacillus]|uniref:amino acid ABC transporter permease n=1 Tax=unclassified Lacticaseibacillus TaxID=2759744 RepID=UPI001940DBEA|nr:MULTISPECIES: amino acid ABC transporter permease [unclassified Lacticaseibacillus]